MDKSDALVALAALGQDTRLDIFRTLVKAGEDGLLVGDICKELDVRQNTMSSHLSILHQSALVSNRREGRAIRYFASMERMRGLLAFLMEDCCGGRPELCQPVIKTLVNAN